MKLTDDIRQYLVPAPYRIYETAPTLINEELPNILRDLENSVEAGADERVSAPPSNEWGDKQLKFLAEIATQLWRLRRKMLKQGTEVPVEGMESPYRHVSALWDTVIQEGIEVSDPINRTIDPGMALKILTFQPMPGITKEAVIETIRPSIYFRDRLIQMAEVVAGRPAGLSSDGIAPDSVEALGSQDPRQSQEGDRVDSRG